MYLILGFWSGGPGEDGEVLDQAVYIRFVMLHRDQPLLDLAPRRQENPAVVLVEPVRVAVPVVHAEEAAIAGHGVRREHDAALGARGDHVRDETVFVYGVLYAGGGALAEALDVLVRLRRRHLGQHGPGRGHGQRVPVERADHLVAAVGHVRHRLLGAADGGHGHAAAHRLGQGDHVGLDVLQARDAPRADGEAGLDLVEGEQRAVVVEKVLEVREVAGPGLDDPGVHHDRLQDHARDLALVLVQQAGHAVQVVERGDQRQVGDGLRDAGGRGGAVRFFPRARVLFLGSHGDLYRVVVAVVAALDLDDQVPAGDRPHQVDGVHGGFGAGVGETPAREAEPEGELVGHRDRVRRGLGEVGAVLDLVRDGLHDRRVGVASQGGAVAAVQVDVFVAVDIGDLRAAAAAQPDRLRHGDLPAGGDAAGEVLLGLLGQALGLGLTADEDFFLLRDDRFEHGVGGRFGGHVEAPGLD